MKLKTYHTQINLDLQTPISVYLSARAKYANTLLLESSDNHSKEGNYSFIACNPISSFEIRRNTLKIQNKKTFTSKPIHKGSCINKLEKFVSSFETENIPVCFPYSAVFGYSSFDVIHHTEDNLPEAKQSDIPEVFYSFYSLLIIFDHAKHQAHIVSFAETTEKATVEATALTKHIYKSKPSTHTFEALGDITSSTTNNHFLELVTKAKQHCQVGDVFQLVLSRKFKQKFLGDEFNVYRCLKQINPSPYLFFFDLGAFKIFGSSPEAQLVVKNRVAEIHPIAGTYKRTNNEEEDRINAQKLTEDPKENSEHSMLVDLARNDLSSCCTNVVVERLKELHYFSHVIHLVSKVTGKLKPEISSINLLYGSFPAGTLSGAPKHRALQLIADYELESRNFYGGCVGYIETNGNINHAIMIRSFLSIDNALHFQAGAGIVINSNDENELAEIEHKTNALKKAIKEANKLNIIPTFA